MKNEKSYKYIIIICVLAFLLLFTTTFYVGTSISTNRRYRAELERSAQLEQTVREQEQTIRKSSECIRRTSTELGDLIQSSNGRIEASIEGVQSLREAMQYLENDYNSMRNRLLDILGNLDGVVDGE